MPRLKRLDATDLLKVPTENDDYLVVTKQEVAHIIRKFIQNEIGNLPDEITTKHRDEILKEVNKKNLIIEKELKDRLSTIEKELSAFIDFKFDALAEKACDLLISRKFNEEIEKRVQERTEYLLTEKQKKGKF